MIKVKYCQLQCLLVYKLNKKLLKLQNKEFLKQQFLRKIS